MAHRCGILRLPTQTEYRWFEVSYKDNALTSHILRGPYAVSDLRDADMAAGGGLHNVEIESGPTPIDGEDAEAFIDRWLHRLSEALPWQVASLLKTYAEALGTLCVRGSLAHPRARRCLAARLATPPPIPWQFLAPTRFLPRLPPA